MERIAVSRDDEAVLAYARRALEGRGRAAVGHLLNRGTPVEEVAVWRQEGQTRGLFWRRPLTGYHCGHAESPAVWRAEVRHLAASHARLKFSCSASPEVVDFRKRNETDCGDHVFVLTKQAGGQGVLVSQTGMSQPALGRP